MSNLEGICVKGGKELDEKKERQELDTGTFTTSHKCYVHIQNNWGHDINNLKLEHTSGDHKDIIDLSFLKDNDLSKKHSIKFETGMFASHDYWWVRFSSNGKTWACKTTFYCDQRSSDEGTTTTIMLSGGDEKMYIQEASGNCYVDLKEI